MVPGLPNDAIVGYFIANELPPGLVGLIIAGIFAAAMSTLSSSIAAVAAVASNDFLRVLRPQLVETHGVKLGRWVTLGCGVFATAMALWVASVETTSLWDKSVRLLALFGGSLPGVFALGMLTRRANAPGVIVGAVFAIGATVWIQNFTSVNAFFHTCFAFLVSLLVGYVASLCFGRAPAPDQLRSLTVWDLKPSR
jgi:Na+/proline symporter